MKIADVLKDTLDSDGGSTDLTFELLEQYLSDNPLDEKLWDARGDYIQIYSGARVDLPLEEAKAAYLKAIECNPEYARAYESLGYYLDVIEDSYVAAEENFQKALRLEPTLDSYIGLARVIAQQDRKQDALDVLEKAYCPFFNDDRIINLRNAIKRGEWSS